MFKYLFVIIFLLMSVNALKTQDEIILTSEGFSYSTKITNIGTEKFSISFVNPEQKFPILSEVQIINKFGDKIAYNEENIQLKFSGIRRGYPIFNVEMTINESILNANLRFKIIYNNKINTENYNSNTFNRNFFADIVNFDHLNYINPIENEISKNQLILQSDDWFDFNVDYVKLTTKNEGVFIALLKDILQIMPAWKDKESNYINMLHLGEQYPFYLVDFDGKINDADTIYFLGQFPKGDTTYYDFYMPESAFFLFYDVNNLGRRLELSKQDNFSEEIKSVYMDKHIQKFQTFFEGTTKVGALSYNIESEWNSGFYWDRILILNNKLTSVKYNQKVPIYPSDNREDSISIFYDYTPERDVSEKTSNIIKHSYNLYANGQKIDTIGFQGRYKPYKYYSFKGALSQGLNNLGLELFNIDKDVNGNLTLESVVQFRSFDILGKQKPFAENDNLSFSIEGADNYKITTSKFKSPPVFINQSNSKIYFPKSNKSEFIAGGCENGYNPYLHSVINDIEYFYNGFALIISYRDLTLDSIITQVFKNDSYSMIELLEKIKNFPFVISSNLQTSLSEDFITKLSKIANIDGKLISPNMCWTVIKNYQDSKIVINDKRSSEVSVQNAAEGNSYSSDLITGINGIAKIFGTGINSIERAKILEVSKNNIKYENQQADILIITNPKFLNAAEKLANLRRQTLNMSAKVISTEDIYNQFNDGRLSPKAIKEFLKYSYSKWRKPSVQYAILIGSANFDSRNLLPNSLDKNNLPIYGYPSSDYWYGELDENLTKAEAEIIVGRIPAHTIDDAENYYEKAFSFYNSPVMPWHKNFLFISGGDENEGDQMRHFKEMLEFNIEYLTQDSLICDTTFIFKELGRAPISYSNQIIDEINSGAIWTTYLGHGAPTTFEIDGWNAKYLSNKNKYGVLTTVSCNTGGFQFPTVVARNEEYVLEKNKGHIAAIGSTFGSEVGETTTALQYIFEALKEKKMRRLGDMLYYAKHKILYFPRTYPLFSLLGDPLVELPISKQIDFHIENKYISFANENGNGSFIETDSLIQFKGQFYNMGYNADSVKLIVIREYQNQRDTLVYNYFNKTFSYDFEGSFKINFKPGVHTLKFIIDPYYKLIEEDKENNLVAINFEVFKNKVLPIEPLANWNIRLNNPQIRIVNPLVKAHHNEFKYEFLFIDKTTNSIIAESKSHKLAIEENYVEWIPEIQLKHNKSYLIRVKSIETVTNTESDWFELPVRADYNYKDNEVSINLEKQEIEENCQTNNLVYNESEGLTLKNVDFPFKIDSFQDTNLHSYSFRHLYMNIANHIYVADKYPSGIYIVKIPIEKKEFEPKLYHFDTWDNDGVFLKDTAWYHNNPAEQLVRFLRDSVSSDEYLFFATGSGAFRLPCIIKYLPTNKFANNIGHLDTLKKELSKYGSIMASNISGNEKYDIRYIAWPTTFILFGRKNSPKGSAIEKLYVKDFQPEFALDTATIESTFKQYYSEGSVVSNTIRPIKKINSLTFETTNYQDSGIDFIYTIYGIDKDGNNQIIDKKINDGKFNLSKTNLISIDEIYYQVDLKRSNFTYESLSNQPNSLTSINCNFLPWGEPAVIKSSIKSDKEEYLRGVKYTIDFEIENISPRTSVDSLKLFLKMGNKAVADSVIPINFLNVTEKKALQIEGLTDFLEKDLNYSITSLLSSDIINFNNEGFGSFIINEDKEPPQIRLTIDGKEVSEGSFVAIQPEMKIELWDNSPLPISDSLNFTIFVNAKYQPQPKTLKYEFKNYGRDANPKAEINLIPPQLEYGEDVSLGANSIRIIAADASGNTDTLFLRVNVAQNAKLLNNINYPNPFENQTEIEFDLRAPFNEGDAKINIYNSIGNIVRTISKPISIGKNKVVWDSKSEDGAEVAPGIYYYWISYDHYLYSEPINGRMILVK